ncbi:MAG: exopolysaccharide production protein ExoZ [Acetobacteraceae bacterium]|nr:exopolysaccharide production protein ExoZ [Acetobacteraceae bacterium]
MDGPRRNDLLGVQALRAVAAFMVVAYHAVDQWTTHMPGYSPGDYWPNGSAGVDVFFVISGLVMTLSVRRSAGRPYSAWSFSKDRIIRIVPLYWIVTTVKIITVLAAPALAARTTLDPFYVAGSYALLPVRDATGIIRPVLPVGWTLSYEMLFYILVAMALLVRVPLGRVCIPVLLALAATTFVLPANGFANTIVAEFIFGIAIGNAIPRLQALPPVIGAIVGPVAFVLLAIVPVGDGLARPLTWGVPAALIVAAAVSTELTIRRGLPQWLLAAGNASYATYLTHGFVVPVVFVLCRIIPVDWAGLAATIILSLGFSAIAGQITHVVVEQPLLLRLRAKRPVSTLPAPG